MVAAALLGVGVSTAPKAKAANLYWDKTGSAADGITDGAGAWGSQSTAWFYNPNNLTDGAATASDVVYFGNGGVGGVVDVQGSISIAGLVFGSTNTTGYSLTSTSAQTLTLGTSGITLNNGGVAATVGNANLSLTLGGAQSWINNAATSLTVGGAITNGSNLLTLQAQGAGNILVSGNIVGATSGGITVNSSGAGRVILSGTNTQTGTTTLTAGNLRATSATAFGAGALQLNGGVLQLIGGQTYGTPTATAVTVGGNTTIWSDNASAGAGATATLGALSLGAFTLTNTAGPNVSSGTAGITFAAGTLSATGASIITNNGMFGSAVTGLTTLTSLSGTNTSLTVGGSGNTTISGALAIYSASNGTLTKNGAGTLTLGGLNTISTAANALTINGGSVVVSAGGTFANATPLTFGASNGSGGLFNFNIASTAAVQSLGALSFLGGEGVVQSSYGAATGNGGLTFASLAARGTGASANFVVSGGTNGTTNAINLTSGTVGFQSQGLFFNGADFAYLNATGPSYFRAPVYGTDVNFLASQAGGTTLAGTLTASSNVLTTAAISAQAAASINTLKISSASAADFTLAASQTLTIASGGILRTGGSTSTISGGTGITTTSGGDYVIRTDLAGDAITINTPLIASGTNALVKTGAGTLNLQGTSTFTGGIYVNQGTLTFNTDYSSSDTSGAFGPGASKSIYLNGGTLKNLSTKTYNPTSSGLRLIVNSAGGTFDVNGVTGGLTLDDGTTQFQGSGNFTISNSSATAASATLKGSYTFNGNIFVTPLSTGGITLLYLPSASSGNTVVMGSNTALDLQSSTINSNLVVGGTGIGGAGAILSSATGATIGSAYTTTLTSNTLINNANSLTFNGPIVDNGGGYSLTKSGVSWLNLSGANTYSGGTIWTAQSGAQLAIGNNQGLGTGTLTVNGSSANFVGTGFGSYVFNNSVVLNSDITFGASYAHGASATFQGSLGLGGAVRSVSVVYLPTQNYAFAGPVSNGGIAVTGVGIVTLSGPGSLTGIASVNSGATLSVAGTTLTGAPAVAVGNYSAAFLNLNADNLGALAVLGTNATLQLGGATSFASVGLQLGSTSAYDGFRLSGPKGNVTIGTGGLALGISTLSGFGAGTYDLITTSGGGTITGFNNATLAFSQLPTGYNYVLNKSSTAISLVVSAGSATSLYWAGDVSGNASWNAGTGAGATNTNWASDSAGTTDALFAPTAASTINFSATGATGNFTNTLDQNFSVAGINILASSTAAVTVNQGVFGALTIGSGGITVSSGAPSVSTINAPIILGAAQTWTVASGSELNLMGSAPARGTISSAGTSVFGLTLAGAGKVTLGGFNTFGGGVTTSATGTLNLNNGGTSAASALGSGTLTISGGTLDNTSGVSQVLLTNNLQNWNADFAFTGSNSLSLGTGAVTPNASRTITVNGGTLQVSGPIGGGAISLTKAGSGALTLSAANTFTSGFTLSGGTVNINAPLALGAATGAVTLNGGTINNTSGAAVVSTTAGALTLGADVSFGGSGALTLPGAVTLTADRTITTTAGGGVGAANALSLTGIISGAFNLSKSGAGTLILSGVNIFGGAGKTVTLNAGVLSLGNAAALGNAANTLVINGGALDASAAITVGGNPQTWAADFAFLGSNTLNLGTGAVSLGAGPGTTRTLTAFAGTLQPGGVISNGTTVNSLTINGAGLVRLYAANTFTGTLTVNAGSTLDLGSGVTVGSLNSTTGIPLVLAGGTFTYTRTGTVTQGMTGVTINPGAAVVSETVAASQTLNLGGLTRNLGGTVNFSLTGTPAGTTGITTSKTNTASIIGGWATYGGTSWAVANGATSTVTALSTFTTTTAAGTTAASYTGNVDVTSSAGLIGGNITINSLRFNAASAYTVTLAAGTNTITSGGILVGSTAAANAQIITGGTITAPTGQDLIINQWATTGALTINSVIAGDSGLTKSGTSTASNGIAIIGGAANATLGSTGGSIINTFTGGIFLNAGILQVNESSVAGGNLASNGAGALNGNTITISGGTLQMRVDGNATGTPQSINVGGTTSSNVIINGATTAINADRLAAGSPLAATPALFITALNKTLQFGTLSFNNAGSTLTVTPVAANGYGVEFTGTTTIDKNYTTISSAGTFTASNVVQGLTFSGKLTGDLTGTGSTGVWTKTGTGVLVLSGTNSDFKANINITGGMVAFNSDAALGNTANGLFLNASATNSGLRAFGGGSISLNSGRTITFNTATTANNVIEVAAGTTLTINSAFGLANNGFTKADAGTLVLAADNGIWSGPISISQGALKVANAGALGLASGATTVTATGAALQLDGVSVFDAITLTGSGISSGGALQATGTNLTSTANGLITLVTAASTIGADATDTLNIRGGVTGAQALTISGAGTVNFDTTAIGAISSITKIGSGAVNIGVASPSFVGAITLNAGSMTIGGSVGAGAGSLGGTGLITAYGRSSVTVDDSVGLPSANRLSSRPLTLIGGSFNYIGNATLYSTENLGQMILGRGGVDTITITAGASAWTNLQSVGSAAPTQNSQMPVLLVRGSNLGSAPGAGVASFSWPVGGFSFVGAGAAGTTNKGILPWVFVDTTTTGTGSSFATADATTGYLRPLSSSEYVTRIVAAQNVALAASVPVNASLTVNSLTLNSSGGVTIAPMQTLTTGGGTTLGGVLAQSSNAGISGGLLTGGTGASSGLILYANGDLTLNSAIVGAPTSSSAYLTKAGTGTVILAARALYTGQTSILQGTLRLNAGDNTLVYAGANSFLSMGSGGTLDLNGYVQQVSGLFNDNTISDPSMVITGSAGSTLIVNSDARSFAGAITGAVAFQRGGSATATTLYSDSTYTGSTLISGGTLALTDSAKLSGTTDITIDYAGTLSIGNTGTVDLGNRINDAATVKLRGGTLAFLGRAQTASSETLGAVTIDAGLSTITSTPGGTGVNSADLTLGSLVQANAGMVNFTANAGLGAIGSSGRVLISSNPTLTNNIIGPWAIVGGAEFASYNATYGVGALNTAGFAGYDGTTLPAASQSSQNIRIIATAAVPSIGTSGGYMLNSLNIQTATAVTFTSDVNALNLVSGGLIKGSTSSSLGATVAGTIGTLTAGGTATSGTTDLYIYNSGATAFTINARIVDTSVAVGSGTANVRLVLAGAGGTVLTNSNNAYTGGTVLDAALLTLNNAASTVVVPSGGLTLNNSTVTMTVSQGQINVANAPVLNGASTLTMFGTNTLAGLTFKVDGGAQAGPTVAVATQLTLTGGITASGSNPNATAVISGTLLDLNAASAYSIAVNAFTFNGKNVGPLAPTLNISAPIQNGGIVKTGDGLLQLSGANAFAGVSMSRTAALSSVWVTPAPSAPSPTVPSVSARSP